MKTEQADSPYLLPPGEHPGVCVPEGKAVGLGSFQTWTHSQEVERLWHSAGGASHQRGSIPPEGEQADRREETDTETGA